MSDDRSPSDAGAGTGQEHGDTPREGTPAFDEIDPARPPSPPTTAELDATTNAAQRKDTLQMNRRANVTLPDGVIGPAPDHASAYVPPHAAPKPAVHKTLEVDLVRVDTRPDPRRAAQTQKLPRVPERNNPSDIDTLPDGLSVIPDDDTTDPELDAVPPPSRSSSMRGLVSIALVAFAAVFVIGIVLFKVLATPPAPASNATTNQPTPAPAPAPEPNSAPTPTLAAPTAPIRTATEAAESAESPKAAPPETSAATKPAPQTTKSGQSEVKSPSTSAPGTAEPINN